MKPVALPRLRAVDFGNLRSCNASSTESVTTNATAKVWVLRLKGRRTWILVAAVATIVCLGWLGGNRTKADFDGDQLAALVALERATVEAMKYNSNGPVAPFALLRPEQVVALRSISDRQGWAGSELEEAVDRMTRQWRTDDHALTSRILANTVTRWLRQREQGGGEFLERDSEAEAAQLNAGFGSLDHNERQKLLDISVLIGRSRLAEARQRHDEWMALPHEPASPIGTP